MIKHSRRRRLSLLAAFSLTLIFSIGISAQTNDQSNDKKNRKPDCARLSDAEIVKMIYDNIRAGKNAGEIRHINVRSRDGVVTLEGWTTTKKFRKEVEKFAKQTKCKVVNKLTVGIGGGCGPGMKKCGDICIDAREDCNIMMDAFRQNEK
jgi:osmotically-inducible protein OsmY